MSDRYQQFAGFFILTAHPSEEATGAHEKHPELLRTPGRNQEIKMNTLLPSFTCLEALLSFSALTRA